MLDIPAAHVSSRLVGPHELPAPLRESVVLKQPLEKYSRLRQIVALLPLKGRPPEVIEHPWISRMHLPDQVFDLGGKGYRPWTTVWVTG